MLYGLDVTCHRIAIAIIISYVTASFRLLGVRRRLLHRFIVGMFGLEVWLPDGGSPDVPSNEDLAQRANLGQHLNTSLPPYGIGHCGTLSFWPVRLRRSTTSSSGGPARVNRHGPGTCSAPCWTRAFRASIEEPAIWRAFYYDRGCKTGAELEGITFKLHRQEKFTRDASSTRRSDHGGSRRWLRSRGAQAGMVRSDRGQNSVRRLSFHMNSAEHRM